MNVPTKLRMFPYGMSLENLPDWGKWEIMREIVSNARDAAGENYIISKEGNDVIVFDHGNGLTIQNLIIGKTEKKGKKDQIGQFGEGLKQAALVMTRMGKKVQIWSGRLYLENTSYMPDESIENADAGDIPEGESFGNVPLFAFKYGYNQESYNGTTVVLKEWGENEETFEDKFLTKDMILMESEDMAILDRSQLFNKGVFIKDLPSFELGYNIVTSGVNRDRNVVDDYELKYYVGLVWSKITDVNAWELFFLACKEMRSERDITINQMNDDVKSAMKKAFQTIFGENAVLRTSDDNSREAEHRGAKIVESSIFGGNILRVLNENVGTDRMFVMKKLGERAFAVKESTLTPIQRKNLSLLRKMVVKMNWTARIVVAELESNDGEADILNNIIRLHPSILNDRVKTIDVFIHEIAHLLESSRDNRDEMVNAVTKTAALMLATMVNFLKEE